MLEEKPQLQVSLMTIPCDMHPCPPDDETMMSALCKYLSRNKELNAHVENGDLLPGIALCAEESVVVLTKEDLAKEHGVPVEELDRLGVDAYRISVQLAFLLNDTDAARDKDLPEILTRLLIGSWNAGHLLGELPESAGASWQLEGDSGVVAL